MDGDRALRPIDRLLAIMATLRTPGRGCPWDLEQTFATIAPYTIEEAYEVADAIEHGDPEALKEELGDLLLQVVFHARMGEEMGHFDFETIATSIADKMVRRHPHIFGDAELGAAGQVAGNWEAAKARERAEKGAKSVLDGVARTLPAMTRAVKLQGRAARAGFDWDRPSLVLDKIREEIAEITHEIAADAPPERMEDEMGDVLFACVNLARKLNIDPERALKGANAKFERRFRHIESCLAAQGRTPENASLEEMEDLWTAAKKIEKGEGKSHGDDGKDDS